MALVHQYQSARGERGVGEKLIENKQKVLWKVCETWWKFRGNWEGGLIELILGCEVMCNFESVIRRNIKDDCYC